MFFDKIKECEKKKREDCCAVEILSKEEIKSKSATNIVYITYRSITSFIISRTFSYSV